MHSSTETVLSGTCRSLKLHKVSVGPLMTEFFPQQYAFLCTQHKSPSRVFLSYSVYSLGVKPVGQAHMENPQFGNTINDTLEHPVAKHLGVMLEIGSPHKVMHSTSVSLIPHEYSTDILKSFSELRNWHQNIMNALECHNRHSKLIYLPHGSRSPPPLPFPNFLQICLF